MQTDTEVLVAGAGPTGLVLALWLTAQGVKVRIIDKADSTVAQSRAMVVHARTLELYRQLELADEVVAEGNRNVRLNLWVRGRHRARLALGDAGRGLTPFPFLLTYPQDRHETLLARRLRAMGVEIERRTTLDDLVDHGDHVAATLRHAGGGTSTCTARYLAGCDGARSAVRTRLGVPFTGGTSGQLFYVADVEGGGRAIDGEGHLSLDDADFVFVLPYGRPGAVRLIGTLRDDDPDAEDTLGFDDVAHHAIDRLQLVAERVNWFSTYRVHHRVADRFRVGRAFLLGDAAHVHSPAGGQGMNTGIGDAVNLAWKLEAALRGSGGDALLDTYGIERRAFARTLVATTDQAFRLAVADGPIARFVRTRLAPRIARLAFGTPRIRDAMFRRVSQIGIHYRESPLSHGRAGRLQGGDRLPWVPGVDGAPDNHAPLRDRAWQVHVYGVASPALKAACRERALPLHEFAWTPACAKAGLLRDAAYCVRPDGYLGVVATRDHVTTTRGLGRVLRMGDRLTPV
ncbi:FAD-dependent monooxygenase [Luteimonas pelagia]